MIDALQKVADIRLKLLELDTAKASDAAITENAALKNKHEQDASKIAELESQLETARSSSSIRQTVATSDESPKLRQTIDALKSLIRFLASEFRETDGDPAKMAIAVTLKFGKTAREYVTALGIDFDAYFSNLDNQNAMTEANLRASVNPPEDEDLHLMLNRPVVGVDFAVAALAVVHRVDMKAPVRRVNGANSPRDYAALAADQFND
jgi:hypothetical protein